MIDKNNIITGQHKFSKIIEYVNSHVALVSLLGTCSIAASSVLFKIVIYLFTCGKYMALGVDYQYINITNENVFYQVFLYATIGMLIVVPNYLCYYSVKSQTTFLKAFLKFLQPVFFIVMAFSIVVILIVMFTAIVNRSKEFSFGDINWINFFKSIISFTLVPYLLFCSFGHLVAFAESFVNCMFKAYNFICKKVKNIFPKIFDKRSVTSNPSRKSKPNITRILVNIIFPISMLSVYCFAVGFLHVSLLSSFKIIYSTATPTVVLCETSDYYLVSECVIDLQNKKLIIYTNTEEVIDKVDTQAITVDFDKVSKEILSPPLNLV